MEILLAYSYLWAFGFCSKEEYNALLDIKFSENPGNDVLLELEDCCNNCKDTYARLTRYFQQEGNILDSKKFGEPLFKRLETAYKSNTYSLSEFGKICFSLWDLIPIPINLELPFHVLSYADEPLSFGDEKQAGELYEKAFNYKE